MACVCELVLQLPSPNPLHCRSLPLILGPCFNKSSISSSSLGCSSPLHFGDLVYRGFGRKFSRPSNSRHGIRPSCDLSAEPRRPEKVHHNVEAEEEAAGKQEEGPNGVKRRLGRSGVAAVMEEAFPQGNSAIVSACFIGLLTGIGVVLFNNAVHEIRDFFWDGIPYRGATWLREQPIQVVLERVIAVPVCGGFIVGILNALRGSLEGPTKSFTSTNLKAALEPILKTVAASVTLGTGNSLGPEGPSVEIGASIAKGVGSLFDRHAQRKLSLVAAGSAAGISSGFNAAVAGCFFAVESVLWPSTEESSSSLTNATSMVILSSVIASVVTQIGLGSEPAFIVPGYDFRSPMELPLYLLLGVLCGLVSLMLSRCTSFMLVNVNNVQKLIGIPKDIFPVLGGLAVGLIALAYPEILYWGFENVDILLESRPFAKGLSADLLLQLVAVKIVATSLCRASGLVGGYYAPSLFIGAATGMAYGKFVSSTISQFDPVFHLSFLEVASPQAYGLVGMAATLAGVCQVPLTAVLLLFELTQDYRIVLPLLGAVGLSSWITSGHISRGDRDTKKYEEATARATVEPEISSSNLRILSSIYTLAVEVSDANNLCKIDNSLCLDDSNKDNEDLERKILVSQAMRTRFVTIPLGTLLTQAVNLMFAELQSCAVVVDDDNLLIGLLTLRDIQAFSESSKSRSKRPEELLLSEVWSSHSGKLCTITPSMNLFSAKNFMSRHGISQVPVIKEHVEDQKGMPVGLLDKECISLACRS
ncbi:chloride channel protein CLC-e isoform X2 [Diospyros lotus]|uniref:chloride channel protein CLC-e isoform X2 n=1 Tax=Diospyros lotus TaxID=55363 RepID=UPI00224F8FAC|nr:chloride channel protein CLC-e isoform X2 [Diospyros lotus]